MDFCDTKSWNFEFPRTQKSLNLQVNVFWAKDDGAVGAMAVGASSSCVGGPAVKLPLLPLKLSMLLSTRKTSERLILGSE